MRDEQGPEPGRQGRRGGRQWQHAMAFNSSKLRFKALERPSGYHNYSVNINLVTMVYTSPTHTAVGIKPYAYTLRCIDKRRYKRTAACHRRV